MPNPKIGHCSCGRLVVYRNSELLCPTCRVSSPRCDCSRSVDWYRSGSMAMEMGESLQSMMGSAASKRPIRDDGSSA